MWNLVYVGSAMILLQDMLIFWGNCKIFAYVLQNERNWSGKHDKKFFWNSFRTLSNWKNWKPCLVMVNEVDNIIVVLTELDSCVNKVLQPAYSSISYIFSSTSLFVSLWTVRRVQNKPQIVPNIILILNKIWFKEESRNAIFPWCI